jgi:prepilin-type N-terminal cleavage/methylation domain-containing protein
MRNLQRSLSASRKSGGFTLVELLVVIGIIAILAGVALGPITTGIRKARESACMQTCRTLALAEFQYANDNNNYPDGADAGVLAAELVAGNYISDASIMRITGGSAVAPAAGATIAQANVDYNFMGMNGAGATGGPIGVNSSAQDGLPLVWSPNGEATVPSGTGGLAPAPSGLFGTDGFGVSYKNNNAFFRTAQTAATPTFPGKGNCLFVDDFEDMDAPGSGATANTWGYRIGASGN